MNFEDIEVKVDKPYPEIVDAQYDMQTVAVLKNLATSQVGELEAVLSYIYQSVIADKTHKDIADIFEEVAVVEMMHLDMLMHAITDFGGNPKYEDSFGAPFTTKTINYTQKLNEMLTNNIAGEEMAIKMYKDAIMKVKNQSLKDLFARIILDEEKHLQAYKTIKDTVQFLSI